MQFQTERQSIADMSRKLADSGYFAGTGGNIALALGAGLMAVTPSATDYYAVRAQDVVVLDMATLAVVEGEAAPTIEKGLHGAMLRRHPSRRASVHTHQPIASAVALLHETLNWPQGRDPVQFGRHVALVPYRPSGTGMLVSAFAKALRDDVYAYLMASHGVICAAVDLDAAFDLIRAVDDAAAAFLRARLAARAGKSEMPEMIFQTLEKALLKDNM